MAEAAEVELTDVRAIRALAHPARLAVVEAMYDRGLSLTATAAARLAGTTPSAMSYHLRALERYGIVRRGEARKDGRERPWVRSATDLRIRPEGSTNARAVRTATAAVLTVAVDALLKRLLDALDRAEPADASRIQNLAGFTTSTVLVTNDEGRALLDSLRTAIEPYREEIRTEAPADARRLTMALLAVPEADEPSDREGT